MVQENGNVLFLILIAVALFAALALAVSTSMRNSGGTSITPEKARTYASAILDHAATVRSAVIRVKVSNRCTESMLDFSNNTYKKYDGTVIDAANTNAPPDGRCHIYAGTGGNVVPAVPPFEALDVPSNTAPFIVYGQPGHGGARVTMMTGVGTDGAAGTASANDLQFNQNFIKRDVCLAINTLSGVANPGGEPPADIITGTSGSYTNGSFAGNGVFSSASTNNHGVFCHYTTATGVYQFVSVLIER